MTDIPETTSTTPHADSQHAAPRRSLSLFGAVVIGVALVGYLLGITESHTPVAATPAHRSRSDFTGASAVPPAAAYAAMHTANLGPNANWSSEWSNLRYERPALFSPVTRTTAMKLAAIADRSVNRAFDGAPPVIPHPIEQQSAGNCLVCHGNGMKLGGRVATKLSHPYFSSCTQCHVESRSGGPFGVPDEVVNSFVGLDRSGPGTRALAGSPPTIPHPTWMRDDCLSCHGTITRPGLRTTHPWLSNCTQCHAASAELDQSGPWTAAHNNPE